ncbi:hypothetical protein THAOC_02978, partial [Thalassiosira oceanica]
REWLQMSTIFGFYVSLKWSRDVLGGVARAYLCAVGGVPLTLCIPVLSADRRAQLMAGIDSVDYFTLEYILDLHPWCTSGQYWPLSSAAPVSRDTT